MKNGTIKLRFKLLILVGLATGCLVSIIMLTSRSTAQTAPTAGAVTYHYDSLGRLVEDIYPSNSGVYDYDAAGNRTTAQQN